MQVHFITVKIRIIWRGTAQIESECFAHWHYSCSVTHNRHTMKRGLAVEQYRVSITHGSFNRPSLFELLDTSFYGSHIKACTIRPNHIFDGLVLCSNKFTQMFIIKPIYMFNNSKCVGHVLWHTNFAHIEH